MEVIYSDQKPKFDKPSIFLAGPTYRSGDKIVTGSFWRKEALSILSNMNFNGIIFVPELSKQKENYNYVSQVEWEDECLERSDAIMFWVPRDKDYLIGLTTNVEFGRYVGSGRISYGRPDDSYATRYLDWLYYKVTKFYPHNRLDETLKDAVSKVTIGSIPF